MSGWLTFWVGLSVGALIAVPAAWLWGRRIERRVRDAESRARSAERLAEIGTMTSGLAHEIKNPLSTLGLNAQLLEEDLDAIAETIDDPDALDRVGRAKRRFKTLGREANRLRDILEDFLRFAGRVRLNLHPTDAHRLIEELVDFFEPQAAADGVTLRTQLDARPATLPADGQLLKQALLNLLINAVQAMAEARDKGTPHGGADLLMIRTDRRKHLGREVFTIHVIDTGPGMPDDVQKRVFEPYFSTKSGGTGLGLPTTRRIVEEHGGAITVHADPGHGTDFTITLPTDEHAASTPTTV
ncbi:MAG: ATP-binding protein [Planctomycetota bacterium]